MILLMSSAVPPSHRTRLLALLYRIRCGSVSTTILHAYCTAVQRQHPRQSRTVPPPALVWVHLYSVFSFFVFARVALSGLAGLVRIVRFAPAQPLARLCLVAQQVSSLQNNSTKRQSSLFNHMGNKQSLGAII